MGVIVSDFFQISGMRVIAPETLSELIIWMAQVAVSIALVLGVFRLIGGIVSVFCNWRIFR